MAEHIEIHDTTKPEISTREARQATSGKGVVYVLAIGLALVIIAFAAIYIL